MKKRFSTSQISDLFMCVSNRTLYYPESDGFQILRLNIPGGNKSKLQLEFEDKNETSFHISMKWEQIRSIHLETSFVFPCAFSNVS